MKPDVEEAIKHAKFVADYYDGWVPETSAAIRTLLDAYASRETEVKEAVGRITELEELVAELTWATFIASGGDIPPDDKPAP